MINFLEIGYLKKGNKKQRLAYKYLTDYKILNRLAAYSPTLTGTIPIEIDIETSDLDIICYWKDQSEFKKSLMAFSNEEQFMLTEKTINGNDTVISRFKIGPFQFEIFGQNRPVTEQDAYLHMINEYKILQIKGQAFKYAIVDLKKKGIKTEPAFGILLGLKNPYTELLNYSQVME